VKHRRIRFTRTAQAHIEHERAWWLANRDHVEVFAEEFEEALRVLSVLPGAGTPYTLAGIAGLRRIYLGRVGCHLYYAFDDAEVIVRAFWGARRGRGPFGQPEGVRRT
jgi:plasmid stabilization system protein ParE